MTALRLLPELEVSLRAIPGIREASVVTGPIPEAPTPDPPRYTSLPAPAKRPSRSSVTCSPSPWRSSTSTSTTES